MHKTGKATTANYLAFDETRRENERLKAVLHEAFGKRRAETMTTTTTMCIAKMLV